MHKNKIKGIATKAINMQRWNAGKQQQRVTKVLV